jgi:RNA polymerase sigma-70 factor (ECF subfamily)
MDRAAEGDSEAFARLIAPHRGALVRFADSRLGGRGDLGEDAVQEALTNGYRALATGTRPENLRAWLFTIVHNCAVNLQRSQRPVDALGENHAHVAPDTAAVVEQREWMDNLMAAIGALPDRQRQVLVGAALEGRSYQELAERHSTTIPAIKTLLHRARRHLSTGSLRHAFLPPWGWAAACMYRVLHHGKLASKAAVKPLLAGPLGLTFSAATIASTVLLALPGASPGPAGATPAHLGSAHLKRDARHSRQQTGAHGTQKLTPAALKRHQHHEAHQAITRCLHGQRLVKRRHSPGVVRYSPAALRYAIDHLPTFVRQYTMCEYALKHALLASVSHHSR